nr:receptor-like protein 12 [Triticum aestivum]
MAAHFPGDATAANGFGRRSLRELESWLLFEANILAPPDMRDGPTGWRLSNGGVPVPPLPNTVAHLAYFATEIELVRASLTDERLALPQYAADNHAAWAAYFEHRQEQRLASTNGAPVVGGTKNSDGRRMWWGVPNRTLEGLLADLEGGNDPPLAYPPPAAPAHRRRAGQWMPRRPNPWRRRCLAGALAAPASSSTRTAGAPPCRLLRASSSQRRSRGSRGENGAGAPRREDGARHVELDDDAALKWARKDFVRMERERQIAALRCFEQRRRGRDEGVVVVLDDSDDDDAPPPPPLVRHGDAGQGSSRDGRVKEEKAAADDGGGEDGGGDGDYSAFSDFFSYICYVTRHEQYMSKFAENLAV